MTKRSRTILFAFSSILFLVGAPTLFLYSQGYRFDWDKRWFTQVGAFYLRVSPAKAEVFIDDQSAGSTTRFFGTVLTEDFLPGTYRVRIEKEGYHSWEKGLDIMAKRVTEVKHIVLIPQNPTFSLLHEQIQKFWPTANANAALLQRKENLGWTLLFWDIAENREYPIWMTENPADAIENVQWLPGDNSFLFTLVTNAGEERFVQQINRTLLDSAQTPEELIEQSRQLRTEYNENPILLDAVTSFEDASGAFWLDSSGVFWQQLNAILQPLQLTSHAFPLKQDAFYKIYRLSNLWFLQENTKLYQLHSDTGTFEDFFSPFTFFSLSPDTQKIAIVSSGEIWVHYLADNAEQPAHFRGEQLFLTRFSQSVNSLAWINAHYLMFTQGNDILISEIDTRDHPNIIKLAEFEAPQVFWQENSKRLIVFSESKVYKSEPLLP